MIECARKGEIGMSDGDKEYDADFWEPLIQAADAGDLKLFGRLLDDVGRIKIKEDVDKFDEHGWTPLMHAVEDGDAERFEKLIAAGANINVGDLESETYPITLAAEHGREEMFFRLVELDAKLDVDRYCCPTCGMWYGFRPADLFVYAAGAGSLRIAHYLRLMGVRPWSATRSWGHGKLTIRELLSTPEEKVFMAKVFSGEELCDECKVEG